MFPTRGIAQKDLKSSAMLYMPKDPKGVYIIHHGTIFTNDMTPTNNSIIYDAIAKLFTQKGYIAVFPDYIGFGISYKTHFHPYLHKETLARNSFDLLEYLFEKNMIDDDMKIFSAGYSEGGFASLAFVELTQQHGIVLDSFSGAAPYNLTKNLHHLLENRIYKYPEYIAYIAYAYEKAYKLEGLVANLFKKIYANLTYQAFENRYSFERVHRIYPKEISRLFNLDFLQQDSTLLNDFKAKLKENSLHTFIPLGKTTLFSAKKDEIVNVKNSLEMYENLKKANVSNVKLVIDEEETASHFGSYAKFLKIVYNSL